jgi:tetratricopeptide (TPR) repeat protein
VQGAPGSALLYQRSLLLRARGLEAEAEALWQQAEELPLQTARDHYARALVKLWTKPPEALPLLQEARRLEPRNAVVHYALGLCYGRRGDYAKAAASLGTSIALWPEFYASYYFRAQAHHELHEENEALDDLNEVLRLRPDYVPALVARGQTRLARGDPLGAISDLTRALESGDAPTRVYFLRAAARERTGDPDGARRDTAEGLQRSPSDALSWVARGMARLAKEPAGALADFDEALEVDARCRAALEDRAHVLAERLGRTEDAIQALDRAIDLYPDYVLARAGRGVLLARQKRRDAALRDAEAALLLDTRPIICYQVAGIYALTSRQEPEDRREAFRLLASALRGGFGAEYLETDHDLDPIRDQPEFRRLLDVTRTAAARNRAPAAH